MGFARRIEVEEGGSVIPCEKESGHRDPLWGTGARVTLELYSVPAFAIFLVAPGFQNVGSPLANSSDT